MAKNYIQVVRFIRKLPGSSQPVLVEGINGVLYVVKFKNNPQGSNVPFNEAAGIQLYQACHLPVPDWEPLLLSNGFLERNRSCWIEGPTGLVRPESGLCVGIRFLQSSRQNLLEILPDDHYVRIRARARFWLAWVIDICCGHTDNRQAVFLERKDGSLDPVFTDSGNLFGGPNGNERPEPVSCSYVDTSIYPELTQSMAKAYAESLKALNQYSLLSRLQLIPQEWQTTSASASYHRALGLLQNRRMVESILDHFLKTCGDRSRAEHDNAGAIWNDRLVYRFSIRGIS